MLTLTNLKLCTADYRNDFFNTQENFFCFCFKSPKFRFPPLFELLKQCATKFLMNWSYVCRTSESMHDLGKDDSDRAAAVERIRELAAKGTLMPFVTN